MTTVSYALGTPRAAASRGGDCRARDLVAGRNVHGPHRFATTTACQISNGMLRLTVGATGAAPSLTVEAWRGRVIIDDFYTDTYADTWEGAYSTPAWFAMGTLTIDSTLLTALLTGVRIVRISPEAVTIRLVAPVMADAYVTLRRGEPQVRIQHGRTRGTLVSTNRRVRWSGSPAATGVTYPGRVQEDAAATIGMYRYVGALDSSTVNAGVFSATAAGRTTARFGAGVGTSRLSSKPSNLHAQLTDASRPRIVAA